MIGQIVTHYAFCLLFGLAGAALVSYSSFIVVSYPRASCLFTDAGVLMIVFATIELFRGVKS